MLKELRYDKESVLGEKRLLSFFNKHSPKSKIIQNSTCTSELKNNNFGCLAFPKNWKKVNSHHVFILSSEAFFVKMSPVFLSCGVFYKANCH